MTESDIIALWEMAYNKWTPAEIAMGALTEEDIKKYLIEVNKHTDNVSHPLRRLAFLINAAYVMLGTCAAHC